MQIIKPGKLGLISKTYGLKGNNFSIGGLCFFKLDKSKTLLTETSQWPRITEYLNNGLILDMGFAKPAGEVLVFGKAFSKNSEPVSNMSVSLKLGKVNKKLNIVGNRRWTGSMFSPASLPEKFKEMPIVYQNAYGGFDFNHNPVGKGIIQKKYRNSKTGYYALPNIYMTKDSSRASKSEKMVAGFGPIDICWPQRACYQGKYDKHWLENDHPGFPKDTNPKLFNAAPVDQQVKGFIAPGESYLLAGLNANKPIIEGALPALTVRAFIQQKSNEQLAFREVKTHIDTVCFFPELELGVAVYRGVVQVEDSDGLDVEKLLLAYENSADAPRDVAYYEHVLALRTDRETALGHMFNESQLMPVKTESEQKHYQELFAEAKHKNEQKIEKQKIAHIATLKNKNAELEKHALSVKDKRQSDLGPIPDELIASGDFDLSPYIEHAKATAKHVKEDMDKKIVELTRQKEAHSNQNNTTETLACMKARINDIVFVTATDLKKFASLQHSPVAHLLPQNLPSYSAQNQKLLEAANINAISARQVRQHAPTVTVGSQKLPKNGELAMRNWVVELRDSSSLLAGRDLAGADLSGLDFSQLDMRDIMLENANLTGCNFTGARLSGAVLTGATLTNATFTKALMNDSNLSLTIGNKACFNRADLTNANLTKSVLTDCEFLYAKLDNLIASNVDFTASCFNNALCHKGNFVEANLAHSHWENSSFSHCIFLHPQMPFSNWQGANIERCIVVDANAQNANFSHVNAIKVQFSNQGDFKHVNLSHGKWKICGFRSVDLRKSTGQSSVFVECDFGESQLENTDFKGALFNQCIMTLASFNYSDYSNVMFNEVSLRKGKFVEVDIRGSEIINSDVTEALFKHCQTKGLIQRPEPSIN